MINLNILNFLALLVAFTPSLFASSAGAAEGFGYDGAGRAHSPLSMTRAEQTRTSTEDEGESASPHNTTVELSSKFLPVLRALVKNDKDIKDSDKMDAPTILDHLKHKTAGNFSFISLVLQGSSLLNETLVYVLPQLTNLRTLDLSSNGLGPDGAKALAPVLGGLTKLYELDLSCNSLGPDGGRRIASILPRMNSLEHLNLNDNNLGKDLVLGEHFDYDSDKVDPKDFCLVNIINALPRILNVYMDRGNSLEPDGREGNDYLGKKIFRDVLNCYKQ